MAKLSGRLYLNGAPPSPAARSANTAMQRNEGRFEEVLSTARTVGQERRRKLDAITDPVMRRSAERA